MKRYFSSIMKTLEDSLRSLDEEQFLRLVDDCTSAIDRGKKVVVSGLGKNVPVCDKFVGTMLSLGLNALGMPAL